MRYLATYYDGMTARAQPVAMAVTDTGIVISAVHGAALAHWPAERVMLAELPRDGQPVRLGLDGTTARLIVDDPDVVETLRPVAPQLFRRVVRSWGGVARIVGWAGAAVASIAVIILFVVPSLSMQLAAVTPDAVRQRIGATTLRQLTRLLAINRSGARKTRRAYCSDAPGRTALQAMAARLTADLAEPPPLRLVVVNTGMVNAFALPGNFIVLTKGFIENALSPEEVVGVIAHEIGHIAHDHGIQQMYRTAAVSVLTSLVTGDVAGGILVTGLGKWMLNTGYSRVAEREADRYALERLNAAGIDSGGLEAFLARILARKEKGGASLPRFLSTHPPTADRLATVRGTARAAGKVFGGDHREWWRLRLICRSTQRVPPRISTGTGVSPSG